MFKEVLWCLLIAFLAGETALLLLNGRHIRQHMQRNDFSEFIDDETFKKSMAYALSRNLFSLMHLYLKVILLGIILRLDLIAVFLHCFPTSGGIWAQSMEVFLWSFLYGLCFLPLDYWSTFKIEKEYGFNRSSLKLWISDHLKSFCISFCFYTLLFAAILYGVQTLNNSWWIWGSVAFFLLQIILLWGYPKLILPLFNKLTPLADGSLKTRLNALAQKAGFKAAAIQVLDSSRRSSHSNAYCSSLGKIQRVVLYDTLLQNFTEEEIESIVAHEIGHYRGKHILKLLLGYSFFMLILFKVCDLLLRSDAVAQAFHLERMSPQVLLLLVYTFLSLFSYWLTPLINHFSRRYEYEADGFANAQSPTSGETLVHALRKLYRENLGNLYPHPCYSAFHYSHPTLTEREKAIHDKNHISENH